MRLGAIRAVASVDEDVANRVGDLNGVACFQNDTGIASKVLVTSDAAERQTIIDAGLDRRALTDFHCLKADVVRVLQRVDDACTVERDIELARQAVKRTRG